MLPLIPLKPIPDARHQIVGDITPSIPTSLSTGQLMGARNSGNHLEEAIAEEDGVTEDEESKEKGTEIVEDGGSALGGESAEAAEPNGGAELEGAEANGSVSSDKPVQWHRRESTSRRVDMMSIQVDAGLEPAGGDVSAEGQVCVSPASEAKRSSLSPSRNDDIRYVGMCLLGGWVGGRGKSLHIRQVIDPQSP